MPDRLPSPSPSRPALAMVCNTLTPYRVHLHERLAHEIPELELLTLVTHGDADFRWQQQLPPEIHVTHFAKRGEPAHGGMLGAPWTDWTKGKDLVSFLAARNVAAAVLTGYGYPSHLRLIKDLADRGVPFFLRNDANIKVDALRSSWRRWVKGQFFRWVNRRAAGVMPMGTYGEEYFARYGVPREKMYRVPYTPDYDWFAERDAAGIDQFSRKFGLAPGRRRILYSGRLHPVKRVDLAIDAFVRLAPQRPEWDLLIAGTGPVEADLRRRVPPELVSRVVWTGFLESHDLRSAYHACDVLVLPSVREPWAVVVQEAMAAGLAVIASDVVGAARDLVEDGRSGRIFASGVIESLEVALADVTDPARIDAYKEASRARLSTWRGEVDAVREIRRALIEAGALEPGGDLP